MKRSRPVYPFGKHIESITCKPVTYPSKLKRWRCPANRGSNHRSCHHSRIPGERIDGEKSAYRCRRRPRPSRWWIVPCPPFPGSMRRREAP